MSKALNALTYEERDRLSIQEMKDILSQAVILKENEDNEVDWKVWSDATGILSIAGKRGLYDLVPEMFKLLTSWDPYLRRISVSNLGYWLKIPEFKDMAYEIFLNDEDTSVKFSALQSWASYYNCTKNNLVLEELYKILINENNESGIREIALIEIFIVADIRPKSFDLYTSNLLKCQTPEEFDSKLDWQEVTSLLKKYAPNALKHYPIKRNNGDNVK